MNRLLPNINNFDEDAPKTIFCKSSGTGMVVGEICGAQYNLKTREFLCVVDNTCFLLVTVLVSVHSGDRCFTCLERRARCLASDRARQLGIVLVCFPIDSQ